MKIDKPNYTQVPNALMDCLMADMTQAELKVYLSVCRKTMGFRKDVDAISLTQLQKLTGMGREAILNGIDKLVQKDLIIKEGGSINRYSLCFSSSINEPSASTIIEHTKETITKESKSIYIHIYQKFPRVMKMQEPLTDEDMEKLLLDYEQKDVETVLSNMENWKPLLQKNVSAYRTALNWLKRGFKTKENKRFRLSS